MKAERLRGDLHPVAVDAGTAICTMLEPVVELGENRPGAGSLEVPRGDRRTRQRHRSEPEAKAEASGARRTAE